MERTVHITISKIVNAWGHPALAKLTRARDRRKLCRALLPDAYDREKSTDAGALFFQEEGAVALSDGALRMLVNGNRRSLSGAVDRLGSTAFTVDLIDKLNRNVPVRRRDTARPGPDRCREDLLEKLYALVKTSEPKLGRESALFSENPLEPDCPGGPGAEAYARLAKLRRELLEDGRDRAVTWAVLITVLAGWAQWRIGELFWLWDRAEVDAYLARPTGEPVKKGLELHIPFDAPAYMHEYRIHLYRRTARELYPVGKLTMEAREGSLPTIAMELRYSLTDRPENLDGYWYYVGTPMLSPRDSMVYAVMADEKSGATAILTFRFTDFRSGEMYFRVGMLLTAHPLDKTPEQQMVAITRDGMTAEQEEQIRGILTLGEGLDLTEGQLAAFLEDHREADWMPRFRERMLPFLELHGRKTYSLGTTELLEYSAGGLSWEDRLRIVLLLRSYAAQHDGPDGLFTQARELPDLHKLMKQGTFLDKNTETKYN